MSRALSTTVEGAPRYPGLIWRHRQWLGGKGLLNRPWFILGSAPSPATPNPFPPKTAFIHVKYAGRSAKVLGLPDGDLTFLLEKTKPSQIEGVPLKSVLTMRRKHSKASKARSLLPFLRFSEYDVTHAERDAFIMTTLGSLFDEIGDEERPSNGLALICYAVALGVPQIIVSGISLETTGYGYDPTLKKRRRHIPEDQAALSKMATLYPQVVTTEAGLSRMTGMPLYGG